MNESQFSHRVISTAIEVLRSPRCSADSPAHTEAEKILASFMKTTPLSQPCKSCGKPQQACQGSKES